MGFLQRGFAWGNRRGFGVIPGLPKFILNETNPSLAVAGGGGKGLSTLTETNPDVVAVPYYSGGGLAVSVLTETDPSLIVAGGGGKGEVTLTETNPAIEAVVT